MAGEIPPVCKRCQQGPSYHGGHERNDPKCTLHGFSGTTRKEIADFLKQKEIQDAVDQALRARSEGNPTLNAQGASPYAGRSTEDTSSSPSRPSPPLPLPPQGRSTGPAPQRVNMIP